MLEHNYFGEQSYFLFSLAKILKNRSTLKWFIAFLHDNSPL